MLTTRFMSLLEKRILLGHILKVSLWSSSVMRFSTTNPPPTQSSKDQLNMKWINKKNQKNLALQSHPLEIYVGNLSFDAKDQDIIDFFSKCGNPQIKETLLNKLGKKKSFVFIKFDNEKEVNEALALHGTIFMGRKLRINRADDAAKIEEKREEIINKNKQKQTNVIFVWNLPEKANEDDIMDVFTAVGAVDQVKIQGSPGKQDKRFAFVEFLNNEDAEKALAYNDFKLNGQKLKVDLAFSKNPF
ncbi:unnamed protein product [Blepharisma stoltei]|uniref:RRM domain-containing protein n=1 Tax=Blepharisma stoltei TaxID=1481888 RepID=A0AAU9IUC5_9CILI|nr:unnamed protein product [Blepharisma stoltei]